MGARRKPSGRGGWRPGSGRKPEFADRADRTLSLERDELERLEARASDLGVSVSALIRRLVVAYLRREERT